jgi:A/G-specific adenine glycosylase
MPRTASELRKLPGIGPYTSAAIASIAYGEKIPAVDGNLLRIFSRLALYEKEIRTPAAASEAYDLFLDLMPDDRPGDFNQALMDLGSSVCVPGPGALCRERADACPLSSYCRAFRSRRWASLPVMPAKKARRADKKTILVIRDGERVMLRRRPSRGLLAGLYEFPNEEGWLTAEEAVGKVRSYGCQPVRIRPLQDSRHIFSHREWLMHGYEIWTGSFPEEKRSEKDTGSEQALSPEKAGVPFFVSLSELQDRYAVPGAYAAYLSILTGEH